MSLAFRDEIIYRNKSNNKNITDFFKWVLRIARTTLIMTKISSFRKVLKDDKCYAFQGG